MPSAERRPFSAKDALAAVYQEHPDVPDDQLLQEAKYLFKEHAKPKEGRGVYKKDVKEFRDKLALAKVVSQPSQDKPADYNQAKAMDVIASAWANNPKIFLCGRRACSEKSEVG